MTTTSNTIQLNVELTRRLTGAIGEFINQVLRPADVPVITIRLASNMSRAQTCAANHDERGEDSALRSAQSGTNRIGCEILARKFMLKLKYTFQRDMDIVHTEHDPQDLVHSLVAHVGNLLRKTEYMSYDGLGDGTFRLDTRWDEPAIEKTLDALRRRLSNILLPPPSS